MGYIICIGIGIVIGIAITLIYIVCREDDERELRRWGK